MTFALRTASGDSVTVDGARLGDSRSAVECTFDLGAGLNTAWESCNECILVYEDDGAKLYFQSEGSLTIEALNGEAQGTGEGTATGVTLIEVTLGEGDVSIPVPGGDCLSIGSLSWDTDG